MIKSYAINTAIAGVFFGILALVTGRPFTGEDFFALFTFGWIIGWLFSGIFGVFDEAAEDARETVKNLKDGKEL